MAQVGLGFDFAALNFRTIKIPEGKFPPGQDDLLAWTHFTVQPQKTGDQRSVILQILHQGEHDRTGHQQDLNGSELPAFFLLIAHFIRTIFFTTVDVPEVSV